MAQDVYANFQTPISLEASEQLDQLNLLLLNFLLDSTQNDHWTYIWGNAAFRSNRAYKALRGTSPSNPVFLVDVEFLLQRQAKILLLAIVERQIEYSKYSEKEKEDPR